jgi:hypothetical protein
MITWVDSKGMTTFWEHWDKINTLYLTIFFIKVFKKTICDLHGCDSEWVESIPIKKCLVKLLFGMGLCRCLS